MSFLKGVSTTSRSNKIEQFQSTICAYTPVNVIYGTSRVNPNLINYKDFTSKEKKRPQGSGKVKHTSITYLYSVYVEMALGTSSALENGVIQDITKVWVNDKSYGSLSALNANASNEGSPLALNRGDNPNPTAYMQTNHPTEAVGYDKLSYLYGKIFLGEDNASMPSMSFQVKGGLVGAEYKADGVDANPAYIIKDILIQLGLGNTIDATSFDNYANYCQEADLLVSTPTDAFTSQKKAQEVIAELLTLTNTYMFYSTDRFKFIPRDDVRRGTWTPNTTVIYDLDEDDFIEQSGGSPVVFKRKTSDEIYNYITVNFTNRSRDYEEESISFQDVDSISEYGVRSVTYEAKWLHTKERALKYAQMRARQAQTEVNQYQFQLPWNYSRLECGDLVRISCNTLDIQDQVVMISEITESRDGVITVTAIQRPAGVYSESQYSVVDDYNYQDFNVEPSDTEALFIIPPSDLVTSANGLEIWIALHGSGDKDTWGGCDVYVSDQDSHYTLSGTQGVSSTFGKITTSLTPTATSVTVEFSNPETVEILQGSQMDAENGNTLIWVNGECMSYTSSTLIGKNRYTLSGLIRGQFGTKAVAHSANESVAVLDGAIYVLPLTKHYQGKTIYFKFPSFNKFKANNQDLNEVEFFTCVANPADLLNCANVRAYNKYREMTDDVTRYDIVVEWDVPDFDSYAQAQVWYKTTGTQATNIGVIPAGKKASELGYDGQWIYAGQGYNTVVIPQAIIGDTYKIAVCTQDIYNNVESPDMSPQVEILIAMKSETPDTPNGLSISFGEDVTVKWEEVRNADVKRYDLRLNDNSITSSPLLSTNGTECHPILTSRQGTLYVRAVSAYDKISAPAMLSYNKPAPKTPSAPKVLGTIAGLNITMDEIPIDCSTITILINDQIIQTASNVYTYGCEAGVYTVKYRFNDCFGSGEYSPANVVERPFFIPPELIDSESISIEKLSAEAQDAIANGGVGNVNIAVKGLLGEGSALVLQPDGSYALVASNGEKLTGLFANQDGVMRLQGQYIHLTGNTVFDENVQIKGHMESGSISCDNGLTISAGKLALNSNGMSFINGNEVFSCVGRQMIGVASHGKHVTFTTPWDVIPNVMCIPRQWASQLSTYSNTNLYTECYASNVTASGFDVVCRTFAQAGSYSSISYNGNTSRTEKWLSGSSTETVNSETFTLQGNGDMSASVSGSIQASGVYSSSGMTDAFGNPYTVYFIIRITKITASLYVNNVSVASKDIWTTATTNSITANVTFDNVTYTNSQQCYIKYTITYTYDSHNSVSGRGLVTYQALGGSATYRLTSAQQVATGDVTFIVSDNSSNAFYRVS